MFLFGLDASDEKRGIFLMRSQDVSVLQFLQEGYKNENWHSKIRNSIRTINFHAEVHLSVLTSTTCVTQMMCFTLQRIEHPIG